MGIENPVHLLFIAAVALIVLGPKRLPDLAKSLGHGIREFRESMTAGEADEPHVAATAQAAPPIAAEPAPVAGQAATAQAAPPAEAPAEVPAVPSPAEQAGAAATAESAQAPDSPGPRA
jgi:sec-independent protein translocase protein TatA